MAEFPGGIHGRVTERTVHLRIHGRAVAHQCPAARAFVDRGLAAGVNEVRIEFADCDYCDSTFLGTLLRIKKAADRANATGPILVAPRGEVDTTLRKMGLDRFFDIRPATSGDSASATPLPADDWQLLDAEQPDHCSRDFKEHVVVAHRELASSSATGAAIYESIADDVERELAAEPPEEQAS